MILEFLFAGLLGATLGSFLNVLILRLRENLSILGRSQCPNCRQVLRPRHLVPVLSWIFLGGRCAYCRRPIHLQYPLVELTAGILTILAYVRHPFFLHLDLWPFFAFEVICLLGLLSFAVFDVRWKLLPIEPIIVLACTVALWQVLSGARSWSSVVYGVIAAGIFLGAQVLISGGRWLGEGDPWLGVFLGAWLGWPRVGIGLYLTYVVGGLILGLLLLVGIVRRGTRIPFAPLLALGAFAALLFGDRLEEWMHLIFNL